MFRPAAALAMLLALLCASAGCTGAMQSSPRLPSYAQSQDPGLLAVTEAGHAMEAGPWLEDERLVQELVQDRKQTARNMGEEAGGVLVIIGAVAGTMIEMAVPTSGLELLLTIVPASRLGKVYDLGHALLKARRGKRATRKLQREMIEAMRDDEELVAFFRMAAKMSAKQSAALTSIFTHTGSSETATALLRKQFATGL